MPTQRDTIEMSRAFVLENQQVISDVARQAPGQCVVLMDAREPVASRLLDSDQLELVNRMASPTQIPTATIALTPDKQRALLAGYPELKPILSAPPPKGYARVVTFLDVGCWCTAVAILPPLAATVKA